MEAKGSSLSATRDFVKEKFGEEQYKRWVKSLPEKSAGIYNGSLLSSSWYSFRDGLQEPTKKICELFYSGNIQGAWEAGEYSADKALRGVYRFFIKFGSPEFIIKKASTILPTYYKPSRMSADMIRERTVSVKILEFPEICGHLEARIAGWMSKALEISGTKEVEIQTVKSIAKKDDYTEYVVEWS